jgi:Arc/MetJ-type ribon-helix-helix transcriptional regulator
MLSTEVITFRLGSEYVKAIDKIVKTNRRWNSRSELIQTLIKFYAGNPTFRKRVHEYVAKGLTDRWLDG